MAASMVSGTEAPEPEPREERRLEPRHDCIGLTAAYLFRHS